MGFSFFSRALSAHRDCTRTGRGRCLRLGKLLEVRLQCAICLLRSREVAGLQRLAQLTECLANGVPFTAAAAALTAFVMMMVMVMPLRSLTLEVLLNRGVVLLRSRKITGL